MDQALGYRLIELRGRIVANFDAGNWEEIGLLTGHTKIIQGHDRLLRSLDWNDADYDGNVLTVLRRIVEQDPRALSIIESYSTRNSPASRTTSRRSPPSGRLRSPPTCFRCQRETSSRTSSR